MSQPFSAPIQALDWELLLPARLFKVKDYAEREQMQYILPSTEI